MSSKAIICAACSAAVPYGRLSCPSCGELLASVVGAPRRGVAVATAVGGGAVATSAPVATKRSSRGTRATPTVLTDVSPPAAAVAAIVGTPVAPSPPVAEPGPDAFAPAAGPLPVEAGPDWPDGGPAWPDEPPRWRDERAPVPAVVAASVTSPSLANAPGAYVPPVLPAAPAGPPAPARAWAGHPDGTAATAGTHSWIRPD